MLYSLMYCVALLIVQLYLMLDHGGVVRRWQLGLAKLVIQHDLQHAAGPGVPEGPPGDVRGAASSARRTGDVCTNHRDGWVSSVEALTPAPVLTHATAHLFCLCVFAVLRRIKVTLLDTIVRIEHQPPDLETGIALEVHIKR